MNNIAETFSQEECSALLGLHAFTGRDTCSAFKGIGKIKPIKVLQKNANFNDMLASLVTIRKSLMIWFQMLRN